MEEKLQEILEELRLIKRLLVMTICWDKPEVSIHQFFPSDPEGRLAARKFTSSIAKTLREQGMRTP